MGPARLRGMHRPAPAGADLIGLVGPAGGNHSRDHNPQFATGATTTTVARAQTSAVAQHQNRAAVCPRTSWSEGDWLSTGDRQRRAGAAVLV
jgi:hypothetical protein